MGGIEGLHFHFYFLKKQDNSRNEVKTFQPSSYFSLCVVPQVKISLSFFFDAIDVVANWRDQSSSVIALFVCYKHYPHSNKNCPTWFKDLVGFKLYFTSFMMSVGFGVRMRHFFWGLVKALGS